MKNTNSYHVHNQSTGTNGSIKVTLKALVKQAAIQSTLTEQTSFGQKSIKNSYMPQINSPSGSNKSGISQLSAAAQAKMKSEKRGERAFDENEVIGPIGYPASSKPSSAIYPLKPQ